MKSFDHLYNIFIENVETETFYHVTETKNVPAILKNGLLPSKGPRSETLGEPESRIYLFKRYIDLEDAMMNWLGDEFPEESEDFSVLSIVLPKGFPISNEEVEWEYSTKQPIPKEYIRLYRSHI